MPTQFADFWAALAAPFSPDVVRKRDNDGALYITARSILNRLDEVCGPEGWRARYEKWSEDAVLCRLSIRMPDGKWITKMDVGSYTNMAEKNKRLDPGDDDKAGLSDSLKRAAVQFGISRYLYRDLVPDFVAARYVFDASRPQARPAQPQQGPQRGSWGSQEPTGPEYRTPSQEAHEGTQQRSYGPPRNGRQLFAWVKSEGNRNNFDLLKYLNVWSQGQEPPYPAKMVDWQPEQVAAAYSLAQEALNQMDEIDGRQEALAN
jgi:hypothetical protein